MRGRLLPRITQMAHLVSHTAVILIRGFPLQAATRRHIHNISINSYGRSTAMTPLISILIDDRERAGPVPDALAWAGIFDLRIGRLALGDYLVDGRFLFERKTLPDMALSIKDGRLLTR